MADRQSVSVLGGRRAAVVVVAVVEMWAVPFCPHFHNRSGFLRFNSRCGYTQRIYRNKVAQSATRLARSLLFPFPIPLSFPFRIFLAISSVHPDPDNLCKFRVPVEIFHLDLVAIDCRMFFIRARFHGLVGKAIFVAERHAGMFGLFEIGIDLFPHALAMLAIHVESGDLGFIHRFPADDSIALVVDASADIGDVDGGLSCQFKRANVAALVLRARDAAFVHPVYGESGTVR